MSSLQGFKAIVVRHRDFSHRDEMDSIKVNLTFTVTQGKHINTLEIETHVKPHISTKVGMGNSVDSV